MHVYLDDERPTPEGWHRCYWPEEVIELLREEKVSTLSLDHDLGDDGHGTGYDVLLWLEEQVFLTNLAVPSCILVHSANTSAKAKMMRAVASITRRAVRIVH